MSGLAVKLTLDPLTSPTSAFRFQASPFLV